MQNIFGNIQANDCNLPRLRGEPDERHVIICEIATMNGVLPGRE